MSVMRAALTKFQKPTLLVTHPSATPTISAYAFEGRPVRRTRFDNWIERHEGPLSWSHSPEVAIPLTALKCDIAPAPIDGPLLTSANDRVEHRCPHHRRNMHVDVHAHFRHQFAALSYRDM
jgi:hypothetical protein